jgi:hypothetical protein
MARKITNSFSAYNKETSYPSYRDIAFETAVKNKEKWESIVNGDEPYLCPKCKIAKHPREFGVQYMKNDIVWSYRWLYECKECKKKRIANKRIYSRMTIQWAIQIIYKQILQSARQRNIACDLAEKDIQTMWDKQDGKCYYSNYSMMYNAVWWKEWTFSEKVKFQVSMDRKNNDLWYTKSNCVLCCTFINKMKNSLSDKEFLKVCEDVIGNLS